MVNFNITTLSLIPKPALILDQIKEIFLLTSPRKEFPSSEKKEAFYNKWTDHYLKRRKDFVYLALVENRLAAYLMIEPNSLEVMPFFKDHDHYTLFEKFYEEYPAHLHINTHPDFQGKGMGAQLIAKAEQDLKNLKIQGLHLITAPQARNVHFYRRENFLVEHILNLNDVPYLFMGKKL